MLALTLKGISDGVGFLCCRSHMIIVSIVMTVLSKNCYEKVSGLSLFLNFSKQRVIAKVSKLGCRINYKVGPAVATFDIKTRAT